MTLAHSADRCGDIGNVHAGCRPHLALPGVQGAVKEERSRSNHLADEGRDVSYVDAQLQAPVRQLLGAQSVIHICAACSPTKPTNHNL